VLPSSFNLNLNLHVNGVPWRLLGAGSVGPGSARL
jgi:hypothetical protein